MSQIVPLLVAIPLGVAFAIVAMAHLRGLRRLTGVLATAAVLANLVISLWLVGAKGQAMYVGGWTPTKVLGIQLLCDGLSKLLLVTVNAVALAAMLFAGPYMKRYTKVWLFEALFCLMTGAMNGVAIAGDLFNMFVFLEVAAIASYALVGFGCEAEELEAAFKYLVLGTVGSALILTGVALLYAVTGHLNMAAVAAVLTKIGAGPAVLLAAAVLLAGLALKAAMVPFHAWLPDAHPSAPAPISAMLSGVLIKTSGVYAMARVVFNVLGVQVYYANILITLGAISMVVGMFLALGQWDLKRLLAYSSISQAGYIVLALGAAAWVMGTGGKPAIAALCLLGGLFHLINHAAFKSLLFLSSGSIEQQVGTRNLRQIGALGRRMPITAWCCRIGALSIAGVPPFNGFFSKLIIIVAVAMAGLWSLAALAAGVAVGTLLMYVKVQRFALEGTPDERVASAREAPAMMCLALVLLAAVCMVGGLALVPLKQYLLDPAARVLLDGPAALSMGVTP